MKDEVLVSVDGVAKKFCKDLKASLRYGVQDIGRELLGKSSLTHLRHKEFWAVSDVSFQLKRGDCLALIGHNGAGKSTLLKMLNGLIKPDKGCIEMKGRISALIELGAGFNPILTGKENIYNNASILGFKKKEIDNLLDEIIEFSEVGDFINMPVRYYSSGMKVRLGFAVASHLKPDVLILDEVLAVGDAGFRIKSFNKIKEVIRNAAVIFVSHSMPTVSRICNYGLYMDHGKALYCGNNLGYAIQKYFDGFESDKAGIEFNEGAEIKDIVLNHKSVQANEMASVEFGKDFSLSFSIELKKPLSAFAVQVQVVDKDLKMVGVFQTDDFFVPFEPTRLNRITMEMPNCRFADGDYSITYIVIELKKDNKAFRENICTYRNYTKFRVTGLGNMVYAPIYMDVIVKQDDEVLSRIR